MLDPSLQHLALQLHLFTTLFMTGTVWFVQIVHYPSFSYFASGDENKAAEFHQKRTGWIVMPVMLVELATAVVLLGSSWVMQYGNYLWINLTLLILIWVITFFKVVPLHKRLLAQFNQSVVNSLVSINWMRTILWTVRAVLLMSFLG